MTELTTSSGDPKKIAALKEAMGKPKVDVSEEEMIKAESLVSEKAAEDIFPPREVTEGDRLAAEMSGEEIGGLPVTPEMMRDRRIAGKPYYPEAESKSDSKVEPVGHIFIPEGYGLGKPIRLTGHNGSVKVQRTWKDGQVVKKNEILEEDMIEVRRFVSPTATVGHSASMSINMGDFENVKVQVSVFLPCYVEEINEAYSAARSMVDMRLNRQVTDIKAYRDKKRKELGG